MCTQEKFAETAAQFNLSMERQRIYIDVFRLIDSNHDGLISATELNLALKELGYNTSLEQATKMVELVDENNDGMVDFNEFLHMAERTAAWSQPHAEEDILAAFKIFDRNNDGLITLQELQQAMVKMGQPLTRKEAHEMLKAMDTNRDGLISYREFTSSWRHFLTGVEREIK